MQDKYKAPFCVVGQVREDDAPYPVNVRSGSVSCSSFHRILF